MKRSTAMLYLFAGLTSLVVGCSSKSERERLARVKPSETPTAESLVSGQPDDTPRLPSVDLSELERASADQIRAAEKRLRSSAAESRLMAWAELGMLYHSFAIHDAAAVCYEQAEAALPNDHRWPYLLGRIHEAEGRTDEATNAYTRSLSVADRELADEQRVAILCRLGGILIENDDRERASELLARARDLAPTDAWPMFCLARVAIGNGDFPTAEAYLKRARAIRPDAANVLYLLGTVLRRQGKKEQAEELIRRSRVERSNLAARDPLMGSVQALASSARRHIDEGNRLFRAEQYEAARRAFRLAVDSDPTNARAQCNLGSALERLGDDEGAHRAYAAAIAADPDFPMAHFNLGVLAARDGRDSAAIGHYDAVLGRDARHRDARFNRANALVRVGQLEKALEDFKVVIDIDPGNAKARLGLARVLVLQEHYAGAASYLRETLTIAPDDLMVRHDLARLLVAAPDGNVRDGEQGLQLAQSVFAAQSWVAHAETVAMALAELQRFDEAAELQQAAMDAANSEGRSDLANAMRPNLNLFLGRRPCRSPWRRDQIMPTAAAGRLDDDIRRVRR